MIFSFLNYFFDELSTGDFIFLTTCNLIILNSILSYFAKSPILSLIYLIINYCLVGFMFFYSGLIFMGIIFILIYVGAVSILLLFTLMLLDFKAIYYKSLGKKFLFYFISAVFLAEFFAFYFFGESSIFLTDDYIYISWFEIISSRPDYLIIGAEMFSNKPQILVLLGLFLFVMLIASVSIVASSKTSVKQNIYSQVKDYNNNVLLNK